MATRAIDTGMTNAAPACPTRREVTKIGPAGTIKPATAARSSTRSPPRMTGLARLKSPAAPPSRSSPDALIDAIRMRVSNCGFPRTASCTDGCVGAQTCGSIAAATRPTEPTSNARRATGSLNRPVMEEGSPGRRTAAMNSWRYQGIRPDRPSGRAVPHLRFRAARPAAVSSIRCPCRRGWILADLSGHAVRGCCRDSVDPRPRGDWPLVGDAFLRRGGCGRHHSRPTV